MKSATWVREISFVLTSFPTNTLFHFLNIYPYILTSSFSTSSIPLWLSDSPSSSILQPPHASLFESAALAFINSCLVFITYSHNKSKWALPSMQRYCSPFLPSLSTSVTAHARAYCVKEHNSCCQSAGANTSCGCAAVHLPTPALSSYMRAPRLIAQQWTKLWGQ